MGNAMTMIPYSLRKEMEAAAKTQRTPTSRQYRACRREWPRWGCLASLAGSLVIALAVML